MVVLHHRKGQIKAKKGPQGGPFRQDVMKNSFPTCVGVTRELGWIRIPVLGVSVVEEGRKSQIYITLNHDLVTR